MSSPHALVPQPEGFDWLWWNALLNAEHHRDLVRLRVRQRAEAEAFRAEQCRYFALHG